MNADELVPVYTTNDPTLAAMLANELRDEGIEATVEGANQAALAGVLAVRVLVKAWDESRANQVLHRRGKSPHSDES